VHFENVITLEQQSAAEGQAAAAAQARARAQDAQRLQEEVQRIQQEAQRIREEARSQVRVQVGGDARPQVITVPAPPWERRNEIPPQAVDIVTMFFITVVIILVGLPIARAIGRWIDRRGMPSPVNAELAAQMNRIEQAVDTMSVEVERISEAQRFQAKLLTEREKVRA